MRVLVFPSHDISMRSTVSKNNPKSAINLAHRASYMLNFFVLPNATLGGPLAHIGTFKLG